MKTLPKQNYESKNTRNQIDDLNYRQRGVTRVENYGQNSLMSKFLSLFFWLNYLYNLLSFRNAGLILSWSSQLYLNLMKNAGDFEKTQNMCKHLKLKK